ncbi:hypothetical protein [Mycolicibacterium tusciae]|uniref:hypothetical protein n=1 Tax=Mycolicibacterium tusciae TaxID=75922 RepID=UPI00024A3260|nr:hypothetical protein [Mycolicibacterium tusciae]
MTNQSGNHWAGPPRIARQPSTDDPTIAFPAASAQTFETEAPPIVLRRARPAVFAAPEPEKGEVIARSFGLGSGLSKQPELSRNRKIAGNLPAWDPLPPGEIRVAPRRPSGGS